MSSRPSPRSTMTGRLPAYASIWVKPCHTEATSRSIHPFRSATGATLVLGPGGHPMRVRPRRVPTIEAFANLTTGDPCARREADLRLRRRGEPQPRRGRVPPGRPRGAVVDRAGAGEAPG